MRLVFRQSESNWLHFGRSYQCRLGFTKCALPEREKMPYHFFSICWTASSNLILTPAANIDSVLIHSPLYCTEKDKDPSGAKKRDAPALFSVHAGCLPPSRQTTFDVAPSCSLFALGAKERKAFRGRSGGLNSLIIELLSPERGGGTLETSRMPNSNVPLFFHSPPLPPPLAVQ